MLKYIQNIKFFFKLLIFSILNQNIIYNYIFQVFLKNKFKFNNLNQNKKYIQKGLKSQKLGIYLKNLENNSINSKMLNLNYYFLIRFNRKNLFLTLLGNNGNVLCKTNIGSCGFKKKVKSTGYAIK
jgi:ribosomal protein S11